MITYRIGIIPLIKNLKWKIPDVKHPWYADNVRALGTSATLEKYFDSLTCQGPVWGYHPDPTKSVLIVRLENLEAGRVFIRRHRFRVRMGARYLWGYIGNNKSKRNWLRERTLTWEKISTRSEKPRGNIIRRVTPQWCVQSNKSGYFYNAPPGTRETCSTE